MENLKKKIRVVKEKIANNNCLVQWKMDELTSELAILENQLTDQRVEKIETSNDGTGEFFNQINDILKF
jgi:hypothetical protein